MKDLVKRLKELAKEVDEALGSNPGPVSELVGCSALHITEQMVLLANAMDSFHEKNKWQVFAAQHHFTNVEAPMVALELYHTLSIAENQEEMETILDFRNALVWERYEDTPITEVVELMVEMANKLNFIEKGTN